VNALAHNFFPLYRSRNIRNGETRSR
jgi:hypothetical protein